MSVIALDVLEGLRIGHFRIEESNAILGLSLIARLFGDPIRERSSVSRGIVTQTVNNELHDQFFKEISRLTIVL